MQNTQTKNDLPPPGWLVELADVDHNIDQLPDMRRLLLDPFLETYRETADDRPPGLHASEMSGCHRRPVFGLIGTEKRKEFNPKMGPIFEIGHLVHAAVQRRFHTVAKKSGGLISFRDELTIDPHFNEVARHWDIYSSADGLFTFNQLDERGRLVPYMRMVLEIKTMAADEFKDIADDRPTNDPKILEKRQPKLDHVEQCHCYMACLNAPMALVLYVNKSNGKLGPMCEPYMFQFDATKWQAMQERFEMFYRYADEGTVPEYDEKRDGSFACTFCPYSWKCQSPWLARYNKSQQGGMSDTTTTLLNALSASARSSRQRISR